MWTLLLLAAAVRSFAHMPLGISDRNNTELNEWEALRFDFIDIFHFVHRRTHLCFKLDS